MKIIGKNLYFLEIFNAPDKSVSRSDTTRSRNFVIYDQIINSLIQHEYEMGEQILLDSFAEKYGVSRTPVVQAVKLLASDGILEILRNGRVRVPEYTSEQISQICDVRTHLEHYALDLIFRNASPQDFSKDEQTLEEIALLSKTYSDSGNYLEFNKTDLKFHKLLVSFSCNEFLIDIYKRIQNRFIVANYLFVPLCGRDFTTAAESHLAFMEAFKQKDLSKCKQILEDHIQSVTMIIKRG